VLGQIGGCLLASAFAIWLLGRDADSVDAAQKQPATQRGR
jgi:hypothetical protein